MFQAVEIIVPLGGMALTFGIVYFSVMTRHRERIRLIESGADPELFYNKEQKKGQAIKFGALLVGVGVGLLLGNIVGSLLVIDPGVTNAALILICGGGGLLLGNYFVNKAEKEKQNP